VTADVWAKLAEMFEPKPDYLADPAKWVRECLGEFPWSKQREILESVRVNKYTAVHSCHDAGKSFIASRILTWWIDSHPLGEAFVVSTAPSAAQVSAVLWREVGKAFAAAENAGHKLPGRINRAGFPQWVTDKGQLVGYGRKPADYQDSAFQGIHDKAVLVIIDEAGGINRPIWDAVDALATNEDVRVVAIGNPDRAGTHFHNVCTPTHKAASGWHQIGIDGLRTPNMNEQYVAAQLAKGILTQDQVDRLYQVMRDAGVDWSTEEIPDELRKFLVSPWWLATMSMRWGTDSALWMSKARGEFTEDSSIGIIPLGWVRQAMDRWTAWKDAGSRTDWSGRRVISCDVAREGQDQTVVGVRQGSILESLTPYQGADTVKVTSLVRKAAIMDKNNQPKTAHTMFVIDANGIGGSVVDQLRHQRVRNVVAYVGSQRDKNRTDATGEFDFRNNRTAAYWNLRELLDPTKGHNIMLPDIPELLEDLTTPTWDVQTGGQSRIYMEEREQVKKRLGRSPDYGDTAVMSFWHQARPIDGEAAQVVPWSDPDPDNGPVDGVIQWED
jgi:hypothetical protein